MLCALWNARVRRPELSAAVLLEGLVDTHQLAPWTRNPLAARSGEASAWAPGAGAGAGAQWPIIKQRTFVLPVSVKGLAATRTLHGVTTPHLLLLTAGDGVLMLDRRLVDPRRPTGEPKEWEKAEQLMQYSPYLPLRHSWLLTHGAPLPRLHAALAAHTDFESTTLVAAVGLDLFVSRVAPARPFDQLDRDFNYAFFLMLLFAGGAGTWALGREVAKKDLKEAWA